MFAILQKRGNKLRLIGGVVFICTLSVFSYCAWLVVVFMTCAVLWWCHNPCSCLRLVWRQEGSCRRRHAEIEWWCHSWCKLSLLLRYVEKRSWRGEDSALYIIRDRIEKIELFVLSKILPVSRYFCKLCANGTVQFVFVSRLSRKHRPYIKSYVSM